MGWKENQLGQVECGLQAKEGGRVRGEGCEGGEFEFIGKVEMAFIDG